MISLHFRTYGVFVISDYFPSLSFVTEIQGIREKMQKVVQQIYKQLDEIIDFAEHERRRMDHTQEPEEDRDQDFVDLLLATPSHDGVGTLDHETIRGIVMVSPLHHPTLRVQASEAITSFKLRILILSISCRTCCLREQRRNRLH
jgi:hypothetical protein